MTVIPLVDQAKPAAQISEFQQGFQYWLSQYPSGQNVQYTASQIHNIISEESADGSGSELC